jgi:hypothetical protein
MAVAKLKITQSGQSGVLVMGMGKDRTWYMEQPVAWFPANAGTWTRVANATKFRQWTYLVLLDGSGTEIVAIGEPPYSVGAKFTAHLVKHWLIFHTDGAEFEVDPILVPPATKAFKIRENWDMAVSYVVVQGETAGIEIQDPATGANANYIYKGTGLSLPIPKLPKMEGAPRRRDPGTISPLRVGWEWGILKAMRRCRRFTPLAWGLLRAPPSLTLRGMSTAGEDTSCTSVRFPPAVHSACHRQALLVGP